MNTEMKEVEKTEIEEQIEEAVENAIGDYKTNRYKNPYFWIGICGVALAAMGIEPESLTSWGLVLDNLLEVIKNPVAIVGTVLAILGVFIDPTTKGVKDKK